MSAIEDFSFTPGIRVVRIPDLFSHCTFTLRLNPYVNQISHDSDEWLCKGDNLSETKRHAVQGLRTGLLAARCYPDCGAEELRICCDFLHCEFWHWP